MRRGSLKGFKGEIQRVVKIKDTKKEYFITGKEDDTYEKALRDSWPFEEYDVKDKWRIVSSTGEDLTKSELSSHAGTVILEFI
ncbi:MAG: hypothetical protein P1Q69_13245 [Candidatus Thorarchaeota archaeon]|nr:hypothetical protein [Candidatus Thorarchaeota archaeon]